MKVLAINGSAHKKGNTAFAISILAEQLKKEGIETEMVTVGNSLIHQCMDCKRCFREKDEKCVFKDDIINDLFQKMKDADGLILASPIHFSGLSGGIKTALDRLFFMNTANGNVLRHKVGVSIGAVRRSGGIPTVNQMNKYIEYSEMVIPTSNYWNVIHGMEPGEAQSDEEGKQIMRVLGRNMAWTLKVIEAGRDKVSEVEVEEKIMTNFIR